ncbi:hypothetical protein ETU09_05080 [Apibacter muscae]|uniref:Uncharacterized protein n=1 Tax=Apibacter muscae TaxID=2509004 RepID=A0A563DFI0_9FLAO|nr:DUF6770 family protein [Apibacter muscae]TWP28693.1 hypothetical protein ETU09_05080 [Apibacter muscae]
MKRLFLALFLSLVGFISAQIQDLATLASGKLVYNTILYDTDNQVYGYIYFFNQGDVDKENTQMEYVLLDKNLNKVANNTFTFKNYNIKINSYFSFCNYLNNNEIALGMRYTTKNKPSIYSFRTIKINEKTVSPEYWYRNGNIEEVPTDYKEYKKIIKEVNNTGFFNTNKKNNGFFVKELYNKKFGTNKFIKFYNTNKELQWEYEYNPNAKSNNFNTISIQHSSENTIYLLQSQNNGRYATEYKIVALNSKNGEKKYEYVFENNNSNYSHSLITKEINNQLVIAGNYSKYNKEKTFDLDKNLGFYTIILDEKGNKIKEKYTQWEDFKGLIDIDEKGRVEKNYRLRPTEFYIFNNGSIAILTEKFKQAKNGIGNFIPIPIINVIVDEATKREQKIDDFVLFLMDTNFNVKNVKTIEKDLTKGYSYNYLFSQYSKNRNEVAFFYQNYLISDKEWVLGVNTINSKGELKEDRIPMTSKEEKYTLSPIPAKEGYILLREYNEKDDKYNQLRLEKLN